MTPQERQLIDDLFDRLSKLEGSPRDRRRRGRDHARACGARRTRPMRWCRRCWCRTRRSSAPMPASRNSKARAPEPAAVRQLPRFDARCRLRTGPAAERGSVPNVRAPDAAAGRCGTPGKRCRRATARRTVTASPRLRPALWRAAAAAGARRWRWRLVPRHGGGGRSRRGRRLAAALQHPRHDGRRQPSELWRYRQPQRRHRGPQAVGRPGRRQPREGRRHQRHRLVRAAAATTTARARACSSRPRTRTMTTTMTIDHDSDGFDGDGDSDYA